MYPACMQTFQKPIYLTRRENLLWYSAIYCSHCSHVQSVTRSVQILTALLTHSYRQSMQPHQIPSLDMWATLQSNCLDSEFLNIIPAADFEQLETAEDYENLIKKSVRGIPEHWAPEIAKQCLFSPTSSNGKRWMPPKPFLHFL